MRTVRGRREVSKRRLPLADRLHVDSPCEVPGSWDTLGDGERVRYCGTCNLHVHDVAALTRDEAEALLRSRGDGERVCLHVNVRRSDGAVLLADGHAFPSRHLAKRRLASAAVAMSATALAACASPQAPVAPVPTAEIEVAPAPPAPSRSPIETSQSPFNDPPLPPLGLERKVERKVERKPEPEPERLPVVPQAPPPIPAKAVTTAKKVPAPATPTRVSKKRRPEYEQIDGGSWD